MSIASVYCHPDKTIVSIWDIREDVPTLCSLRLLEPLSLGWWHGQESMPIPDALTAAAASTAAMRISLPTSMFSIVRYPSGDGTSRDERMHFEFSMNDPDVRRSTHAFATLDGLRDHEGHPWTIAAACSTRLLETASRLSPTAVIGPSFLSEAAARQHAGSVASTVGALVGKRGEWWESCVIDTDGALRWFDRRPDDTTMDMAVQAREIVLDLRAATTATIESVLLYGDDLVKDDVDSCVAGIGPLVQTVARFNPFRVVGADTDDETKRRCIRLAHMLGPIVGHVRSPLQISFPCASLAAR